MVLYQFTVSTRRGQEMRAKICDPKDAVGGQWSASLASFFNFGTCRSNDAGGGQRSASLAWFFKFWYLLEQQCGGGSRSASLASFLNFGPCRSNDAVGGQQSASLACFLKILVLVGATMRLVVCGVQAWRRFLILALVGATVTYKCVVSAQR